MALDKIHGISARPWDQDSDVRSVRDARMSRRVTSPPPARRSGRHRHTTTSSRRIQSSLSPQHRSASNGGASVSGARGGRGHGDYAGTSRSTLSSPKSPGFRASPTRVAQPSPPRDGRDTSLPTQPMPALQASQGHRTAAGSVSSGGMQPSPPSMPAQSHHVRARVDHHATTETAARVGEATTAAGRARGTVDARPGVAPQEPQLARPRVPGAIRKSPGSPQRLAQSTSHGKDAVPTMAPGNACADDIGESGAASGAGDGAGSGAVSSPRRDAAASWFEIRLEKPDFKFNAAHFSVFAGVRMADSLWPCSAGGCSCRGVSDEQGLRERLHGHRYTASVRRATPASMASFSDLSLTNGRGRGCYCAGLLAWAGGEAWIHDRLRRGERCTLAQVLDNPYLAIV